MFRKRISHVRRPIAYISGPLTGARDAEDLKRFYEAMGDVCRRFGFEPYVPHIFTDPVANADLEPSQVFKTDEKAIRSADLVIAYIGIPSTGVGLELGLAYGYDKDIILLYEKEALVSRLPRGLPRRMVQISFEGSGDALVKLGEALEDRRRIMTKCFVGIWYRRRRPKKDVS